MTIPSLLVALGLALAVLPAAAQSRDERAVAATDEGVYLLDLRSVKERNGHLGGWVLFERKVRAEGGAISAKALHLADCDGERLALGAYMSFRDHGARGATVTSSTVPEHQLEWEAAAPGSAAYAMLSAICHIASGAAPESSANIASPEDTARVLSELVPSAFRRSPDAPPAKKK